MNGSTSFVHVPDWRTVRLVNGSIGERHRTSVKQQQRNGKGKRKQNINENFQFEQKPLGRRFHKERVRINEECPVPGEGTLEIGADESTGPCVDRCKYSARRCL